MAQYSAGKAVVKDFAIFQVAKIQWLPIRNPAHAVRGGTEPSFPFSEVVNGFAIKKYHMMGTFKPDQARLGELGKLTADRFNC